MTPTPPLDDTPWSERLRERGLRVTAGRIAALNHLKAKPHTTATELHTALITVLPSLTPQSVYNIVQDLTEHGLIRRIDPLGDGGARYETRTDDNHHHLSCVLCGRIEDVDCVIGEAPCLVPQSTHGMRVLHADVTFRGICAACEQKPPSPHPRKE
ncbi:transcriptional repressor [Leucobacter insecticola]|uniref:Transcriptional repressor n=1 Tax=Leucobacter insecticola TaxID=2714934 RepID=A0A6G8FHV7_9MICO|nr:Fur family transcriptional regulator [Leucobacter insecticola]QIM15622.1 transcriptional repressor [Leucobacter insecticola]